MKNINNQKENEHNESDKKRSEQFFCWDKKGKLSKQCESQCNVCFRYERNNKKNCT